MESSQGEEEVGGAAFALGPEDAIQALSLLLPGAKRTRYLDQDVGVGEVDGEVDPSMRLTWRLRERIPGDASPRYLDGP